MNRITNLFRKRTGEIGPPGPVGRDWRTPILEIKSLDPDATPPTRAHPYDAGLDIYALVKSNKIVVPAKSGQLVRTGISVNIPKYYVGFLDPRSSQRIKNIHSYGTGGIDYGYHGELKVYIRNDSDENYEINKDTRIAQLFIVPIGIPALFFVPEFSDTSERGTGGFGSTGGV